MKKRIETIFASKYWWLLLVVVLFGVNWLGFIFHARFDLTKEKRYTLSKATKNLLSSLDDELQISCHPQAEGRASLRFLQSIRRTGTTPQLLLEASVRVACLDAHSLRPKRLPEFLINLLSAEAAS